MTLTSSSLLLAITLTAGCSLIKVHGTSLTSATSAPEEEEDSSPPLAMSSVAPGGGGGKSLDRIERATANLPVARWTPVQQYFGADDVGFAGTFGAMAFADELGDSLSHLGRIRVIKECFGMEPSGAAAIPWATCGDDVRTIDLAKADAELRAEGISSAARGELLDESRTVIAAANKVGAAVEAAAKDDRGIAAILAAGKAARAEWAAFAGANRELLATVTRMQAAMRVGHSKGFVGCIEKTRPAFEKVVRATRFNDDDSRDPLVHFAVQLRPGLDRHMITLAYAACAAGTDPSADAFYAAFGNGKAGEIVRGVRTHVLGTLYAPSFKPRFEDRAMSLSTMRSHMDDSEVRVPVQARAAIMTPSMGDLTKVTARGDRTVLAYDGEKVDKCLQWEETDKVSQLGANGQVHYQQKCVKRGAVDSQRGDQEIATMFAAGLAPGVSVLTVNNFPVIAWTGEKNRAVLGVALK